MKCLKKSELNILKNVNICAFIALLMGFAGLGMMDLGLSFLEALITNAFHELSGFYVMGFIAMVLLSIMGIRSTLLEKIQNML